MRSILVKSLLDKIPGKKRLGLYRFLPFFFVLGAALEFSMINWRVNQDNPNDEINFYKTYKRRRAEEVAKFLHDAKIVSVSGVSSPSSSS